MRNTYLLRVFIGSLWFILITISSKTVQPSEVRIQADWEKNVAHDSWDRITNSNETTTEDLWVDAVNGNNSNDGTLPSTAFRTIQRAADLAEPGTTVHIQPGVYREAVVPMQSGNASEPILYIAESGPGTAAIRGSESSSSLSWVNLSSNTIGLPQGVDPADIYYTDLSTWGLDRPPRFVVELDSQGYVVARLPLAREPDWTVVHEWKTHELWWAADGGIDVADCYPPTDPDPFNCDSDSRSLTQVTDRHNDTEPSGIESGNLTTLGNLTGATLVVLDTNTGHYIFRQRIVDHDVTAGRITVDQNCEDGYGSGRPALGWGSKYFIESLPLLLDSPGEWWFDPDSGRLYLWPRVPGNPAGMNIEISRREHGITLHNRSYITLDGLTIEFFTGNAIFAANTSYDKSHKDVIRNATLQYDNNGVWLSQYVDSQAPMDCAIDGFTIENSEIAYMDTSALHIYSTWGANSSADSFIRPGVLNTVIHHNEMHHLGFRSDYEDGVGALIVFADHLRFEQNHIHDVAHNGVQFARSVVQSPTQYDFLPDEIKTGEILIRNNIFERACQNHTDCGALKLSGSPPDRHVFRDLLVTANIFRDIIGWTYIAEQRGHFDGGSSSAVQGMGGFGFYVDNASGVHAYRNIAYNNAFADFKFAGAWRDGDIVYYNNTTTNSLHGFHFGGVEYDTHSNLNTQVVNNIIANQEGYGIIISAADAAFGNTTFDHNLYFYNGWRTYLQGGLWEAGDMALAAPVPTRFFPTLMDIQDGTDWEDHGVEGNPSFQDYDFNDHNLYDASWPDLQLTSTSYYAIDRGVAALPDELVALLIKLKVYDPHWGSAFDIGRYEGGFTVQANPSTSAIEPGGVAHYYLSLFPTDLPFSVTLTATSPSATLILSLEPTLITNDSRANLTVTSTQAASGYLSGEWFTIPIHGEGAGFTSDTFVRLLVGGGQSYLPWLRGR